MNSTFAGARIQIAQRSSRVQCKSVIMAAQSLRGKVVAAEMDKTVTVLVERLTTHPVYGKRSRTSKTYLAHAEDGSCKVGDTVELAPTRPMSKRKRFAVSKVVEAAL